MMLVELFAPKGTLTAEQRRHLSERLVPELVSADGAPADLIERGREMGWLVVHEPEVWTMAGRPADASAAPHYVVRLNVPAGHSNDTMRAEMVARVTRVLAEVDESPQRLYQNPHAWVHINEIPDGNAGAFGRLIHTSDIMQYVVKGIVPAGSVPADEPVVETVIDPICGMSVVLDDTAITVEHDGITYGFCNPGCRDIFMEQQGIAA